MEILERPPRTGMEAFRLMPEGTRCQLINNVLVMSPAPNIPHANALNEIFNSIYNYVKANNLGKAYCAPVDVFLNNKNVFQPDIFFVAAEQQNIIKRDGIYGVPALIIEILSSDKNYDLKKKKLIYEQSGVKEYWVVDPETKWCEGFILEGQKFKSLGEFTGLVNIQMFELKISF